jgi:queuine tRNA-ribosyltransferase subunit QTRTD1
MASTNGFPGTGRRILFDVLSHVDPNAAGPRLGRLSIHGRRGLETPNFFAVTSRGVVPHLTPDVISAHTQMGGVHMALEDCGYKVTCLVSFSDTSQS